MVYIDGCCQNVVVIAFFIYYILYSYHTLV